MDTLRDFMLIVKVQDQILDSCIMSCRILSDFHISLIPMELLSEFQTTATRRVRSSALRQDGPTAASKASRRLKEQKENIKSRDQNVRSAATRDRQQKELTSASTTSPPKSRSTTSTTSAPAKAHTAKDAPVSTTGIEGRQSKLPKSISNNSMKSVTNKPEGAGATLVNLSTIDLTVVKCLLTL